MATYLLTWTTYGTWSHGDERGSVDSSRNGLGTPIAAGDRVTESVHRDRLIEGPFVLDDPMRRVVEGAVRDHAGHRGWPVLALNVRTNHAHVVVTSDRPPEKVMGEFKSWASRRLHESGVERERVWTRHGSTRWLDSRASVTRAIAYVLDEQ